MKDKKKLENKIKVREDINKNTFNEKEYWENRTKAYLRETEFLKKGKK